ncbi:DUF968 domain-containing protein [Yersinia enterocolitica]|uniref:DUF968 domain-containing protein n=1 Tax=Yersinia enterocolitica TaxID=630 RepID=UPI001C8E19E4|nr:DUF968 domain-containing protein [Yersinia enterocolitica]MBX9476495.1 DUF968 domain-containing protein [Yersinia enterocolitica]
MVCDVPSQLINAPVGELPPVEQFLVLDNELASFFTDPRVINVIGGVEGLHSWVASFPACQGLEPDHTNNLVTVNSPDGALRLCWSCDNAHYLQSYKRLADIAKRNKAEWIINSVSRKLGFRDGHQLTLPELFCWAVLNDVADAIPTEVMRRISSLPDDEVLSGTMKEADINPWHISARELVTKKVEQAKAQIVHVSSSTQLPLETTKSVFNLVVDNEPPAAYMLKPKMTRLELPDYLRWVKTQACCGCGHSADDPHHIINHGFGGMGTKAHDLLVMPLCRFCHSRLHEDVNSWEQKNGSQLLWVMKTLNKAAGLGVIARA